MLKIFYSKNGIAYPDYKCEQFVQDTYDIMINKNTNGIIKTSTFLIVEAARVLICEGKLDFNLVEFYLENEFVDKADKDGRFRNWPKGFCDYHDDFLDRLLNL